jgi:hypothetical protein
MCTIFDAQQTPVKYEELPESFRRWFEGGAKAQDQPLQTFHKGKGGLWYEDFRGKVLL